MSILGIGAPELLLILLLVVVILGPERAREAGTMVGRFLKRLISSQFWRDLAQAARFMQQLPQNLLRMAELEETGTQLRREVEDLRRGVEEIRKPVEALSPARLTREPLQATDSVKQIAPGGPVGSTPSPAWPAEAGTVTAGSNDDDLRRRGQELGRYAEEWPATVQRVADIEHTQAELAEQLRNLQAMMEALRGSPAQDERV